MTAEMGKADGDAEFCEGIPLADRSELETPCLSLQQYSWLDALQDGGITTYAGWENHFDKWSAAMYWSIVTITSVGYGDITPQNPGEMRMCTLLLLWGSCLWAYIIGNACGIVSTLDVDTMQHHQRMDQLNFMYERARARCAPARRRARGSNLSHDGYCPARRLEDQNFPHPLRIKLRAFFHQSKLMLKENTYRELLGRMSPLLHAEVAVKRTAWLEQVNYLRDMPQACIVRLGEALENLLYTPQEIIQLPPEGGLAIVARGICSLQGHVKTPGTCWGEDFILSDPAFKDYRLCLALTYVELHMLKRGPFFEVLADFPEQEHLVRRETVRMAARRGMMRVAAAMRKGNLRDLKKLFREDAAIYAKKSESSSRFMRSSGASEDEVRALRARVEEINASLSSKLDAVMRALQTNGAQAKPKRGP